MPCWIEKRRMAESGWEKKRGEFLGNAPFRLPVFGWRSGFATVGSVRFRSLSITLSVLAAWLLAHHHTVFELAGLMNTRADPVAEAEHQRWHDFEDHLTCHKDGVSAKAAAQEQAGAFMDAGMSGLSFPTLRPVEVEAGPLVGGEWFVPSRVRDRIVPPPGAP